MVHPDFGPGADRPVRRLLTKILGAGALLALVAAPVTLGTAPALAADASAITIPVGGHIDGVAVDPNTDTVYVASHTSLSAGLISVIDGKTDTVTSTIPLGCAAGGIGVNPDTGLLYALTNVGYACGGWVSTLFVISEQTQLTVTTYPVMYAASLLVDPVNDTIYVTNNNSGVVAIDAATGIASTIPIGMYPTGTLGLDSTTDTIDIGGVACASVNGVFGCYPRVETLDGATNTLSLAIGLGQLGNGSVNAIAYDAANDSTYIAYGHQVLVAAPGWSDVTPVTGLGSSSAFLGVAADPSSHTVYAADGNALSLIDDTTNSATSTVSAGNGPYGVAADPTSHAVYVSDSDGSITVLGAAPKDITPPVVTVATTATADATTGWYNIASSGTAGITVDVSAADPSGITGISCTDSNLANVIFSTTKASGSFVLDDSTHSIICSATDGAGNTGASAGSTTMPVSYLVDQTAPTVTFAGNDGTYSVAESILITCLATDDLSGVASTDCLHNGGTAELASGPAYDYPLGTTTLTATATDNAGNVTTASTAFTVVDSATGLQDLITQLTRNKEGQLPPGAGSLLQEVGSIASAPNAHAKAGKVGAFDNHVAAQTGRLFGSAQAQVLERLAGEI